jgi:hypothetical protein
MMITVVLLGLSGFGGYIAAAGANPDWGAVGGGVAVVAAALLAVGYMFGQLLKGKTTGKIDALALAREEIAVLRERCDRLGEELASLKVTFDAEQQAKNLLSQELSTLKALFTFETVPPALQKLMEKQTETIVKAIYEYDADPKQALAHQKSQENHG